MSSILNDVKKTLGIDADYNAFDQDIILHINSVFVILNQLGAGPSEGFSITDETSEWDDYYTKEDELNLIKAYMYAKVRLNFDPPTMSFVLTSLEKIIEQYEFRINCLVDRPTNY